MRRGGVRGRGAGCAAPSEVFGAVDEGRGEFEGARGEVRHTRIEAPPDGRRHDRGDARRARFRGREQAEDDHQLRR